MFPGCKIEEVRDRYRNLNGMLMSILAILHLPLWVVLSSVPEL